MQALGAIGLAVSAPAASAGWSDLAVSGGATAVYQRETDRGAGDWSASGDLRFELPAGDSRWFLYVEGSSGADAGSIFNLYPEINADAGSVLDSDGSGHVQVSEFHYSFGIGERSRLTIGQIDPSAQIDTSGIANDENTQFLGASFKNNATIEFPDYTLGAVYRRDAADTAPALTVMVSASDGIADNPSRSYRDLIDLSGAGKGLFAVGALRWNRGDVEAGAGLWLRTDDRPDLDASGATSSNYGGFVTVDRRFGTAAVNLRAGIANDEVSAAARFAAVAGQVPLAAGTLGLGYARIFRSGHARRPDSGDTDHVEAWYLAPPGPAGLQGSVSLQFVSNPGFDASGARAEAGALVAGVRLHYAF